MRQEMLTLGEAESKIRQGRVLLLAGDEGILAQLPKGNWIAGTIPYFMDSGRGGFISREMVFATDITELARKIHVRAYDRDTLSRVYAEAPEHGFSFIVIPASSPTHLAFALEAPGYESFGLRPLVGWIAGIHLDDLGKAVPRVFNGVTGERLEDGALVMQVELPPGKVAEIGIINIFEQGEGDFIRFAEDGFQTRDAYIGDVRRNFAEYIAEKGLDIRLPLVADYYGAMINISFQSVDSINGTVSFYAPVFRGVGYRHAKPVADYVVRFKECLHAECDVDTQKIAFSCNCVLNYLYSELEGKAASSFAGPITFGEIAYQLLNQTLVYLEVKDL